MFISSFTSSGLQFWSVNHTSIYENIVSQVLKNIKYLDEKSNNWPNDLLGRNGYKNLEYCG